MDGERVCSWTVVGNGKVMLNEVGGDIHQQFPALLKQAVEDLLLRAGNFHGTLECYPDGSQILTVKSLR